MNTGRLRIFLITGLCCLALFLTGCVSNSKGSANKSWNANHSGLYDGKADRQPYQPAGLFARSSRSTTGDTAIRTKYAISSTAMP